MQTIHDIAKPFDRRLIIRDVVGESEPSRARRLRIDDALRQLLIDLRTRDKTPNLRLARHIGDNHAIDPSILASRLRKKRNGQHAICAVASPDGIDDRIMDARMKDRFKSTSRIHIGEYAIAHAFSVETARLIKRIGPEHLRDLRERRLSRFNEIVREPVGVDD